MYVIFFEENKNIEDTLSWDLRNIYLLNFKTDNESNYSMSFVIMGSPSVIHQSLSMEISNAIYNYIKFNEGTCKVLTAPLDVILKNDNEDFEESYNIMWFTMKFHDNFIIFII